MSKPALDEKATYTEQRQSNKWLKILRLTLQRKYTLTFSLIFLGVIIYLISSLLSEEERDFVDYANEKIWKKPAPHSKPKTMPAHSATTHACLPTTTITWKRKTV